MQDNLFSVRGRRKYRIAAGWTRNRCLISKATADLCHLNIGSCITVEGPKTEQVTRRVYPSGRTLAQQEYALQQPIIWLDAETLEFLGVLPGDDVDVSTSPYDCEMP